MVLGVAVLPRAVTTVPAGMDGPVTYMPTARAVPPETTVIEVEPAAVVVLTFLISAARKLSAVVFEPMVKLVPLMMLWMVELTGMPGPLTASPMTSPAVLDTVMILEAPSVFAL